MRKWGDKKEMIRTIRERFKTELAGTEVEGKEILARIG
jgi:hypothetical protein